MQQGKLRKRRWDVASKTFSRMDPRKSEAEDSPEEEWVEEEQETEEEEEVFRQCWERAFGFPVEER